MKAAGMSHKIRVGKLIGGTRKWPVGGKQGMPGRKKAEDPDREGYWMRKDELRVVSRRGVE